MVVLGSSCPKCGAPVPLDWPRTSDTFSCATCGKSTRVMPEAASPVESLAGEVREAHKSRLKELAEVFKVRPLTEEEWAETASLSSAMGHTQAAARAAAAAQQLADLRQASAGGAPAPAVPPQPTPVVSQPPSGAPIAYSCSNCGEHISVHHSRAGRTFFCPLCGKATTVPGTPLPPARRLPRWVRALVPVALLVLVARVGLPALRQLAAPSLARPRYSSQPRTQRAAQAREASNALHALQAAVGVGVNIEEYHRQLIQTCQQVDRCAREAAPDKRSAPFWREIAAATEDYECADRVWRCRFSNITGEHYAVDDWSHAAEVQLIRQRYPDFPFEWCPPTDYERGKWKADIDAVVQRAWSAAHDHLANADAAMPR